MRTILRTHRVLGIGTMALAIVLVAAARNGAAPPADASSGLAAFETVRQVFQHPRCQNCHIPGDAPLQFDQGVPHAQNVLRGPDGHGSPGMTCATCRLCLNDQKLHEKDITIAFEVHGRDAAKAASSIVQLRMGGVR